MEQNNTPIQTNKTTTSATRKYIKLYLIATAIIFVILVIAAFVIAYLDDKPTPPPNEINLQKYLTPTFNHTAKPTLSNNSSIDKRWKTYVNKQFNYSIDYPDEYNDNIWDYAEGDMISNIFIFSNAPAQPNSGTRIEIGIIKSQVIKEMNRQLKNTSTAKNYTLIKKVDVSGNGTKWITQEKYTQVFLNVEENIDTSTLFLQNGDQTYFITADSDIADKVFDSFKFLP